MLFWVNVGFPGGSAGKESACNARDLGSVPGLGRCPGEGKGYPLQYSGLENSVDCVGCGVAKSRTRLSDFDFNFTLGECGFMKCISVKLISTIVHSSCYCHFYVSLEKRFSELMKPFMISDSS